jgi:tetratricopeptide (TPR) repeat protein
VGSRGVTPRGRLEAGSSQEKRAIYSRHPLLAAALGVLGVASVVRAEERAPESANVELARAEYDLGAEAFAAGRFREAITHFEETNRLVPNPALAYNIALAYDSIGEVPSALRYYRDYLRALPNAEDRAEVIASIRRLEKRLAEWGVQQMTVTVKPAGAVVSVDGTRVGEAPGPESSPPASTTSR